MIAQVKLTEEETAKLKEIHSRSFEFPDTDSPLYVIQRPIYDENMNLVGGYFLHLTSEISLILDGNLKNITKAKIIKDLIPEIEKDCFNFGIEDTHVFVKNDEDYAEILVKHCGFKYATGIPLYRQLNLKLCKSEMGE